MTSFRDKIAPLQQERPMIIAHRGTSGYDAQAENTLEAFLVALKQGADSIELDVQPTKDGHFIVMHDSTLDRTTNGNGCIADMDLQEIQQYQLNNGEPIRTLPEVLEQLHEWCKNMPETKDYPTVFVEVKGRGDMQTLGENVRQVVEEQGYNYDQLPLISFRPGQLRELTSANPNLVVGESFSSKGPGGDSEPVTLDSILSRLDEDIPPDDAKQIQEEVSEIEMPAKLSRVEEFFRKRMENENVGTRLMFLGAKLTKSSYINVESGLVTPELVEAAHDRDLKVNAWTVNEVKDMERIIKCGVDGIMTDFPGKLKLVCRDMAQAEQQEQISR